MICLSDELSDVDLFGWTFESVGLGFCGKSRASGPKAHDVVNDVAHRSAHTRGKDLAFIAEVSFYLVDPGYELVQIVESAGPLHTLFRHCCGVLNAGESQSEFIWIRRASQRFVECDQS